MRLTLIAVFLVAALVSASADLLGLGDGLAFGRLQSAGVFGGIILALLVPWFRWRQRRRLAEPTTAGMGMDRRMPSDRRHAV